MLIANCERWSDISYIRSQGLNTLFICELASLSLNFSQLYEVFSYLCSRSLITYFSVSSNYWDTAGNSAELLPYTVPYHTWKCFSFSPALLNFTGKHLLHAHVNTSFLTFLTVVDAHFLFLYNFFFYTLFILHFICIWFLCQSVHSFTIPYINIWYNFIIKIYKNTCII